MQVSQYSCNVTRCARRLSPGRRQFTSYYRMAVPKGVVKFDSTKMPQFVGHCSSRNMMRTNEDRYRLGFMNLPISGHTQQVFTAGIFDGHGGPQCAEFLQKNLGEFVEDADIEELRQTILQRFKDRFGGYWRSARVLNSSALRSYERSVYDDLAVRLPLAYLSADYQQLQLDQMSGSTCTCAYLYTIDPEAQFWNPGVDSNLVVAQVGDTRALICDNEGNVAQLTTVHHADTPMESDRLRPFKHAMHVTSDGMLRLLQYVNTRAFGDYQGKAMGIIAVPELTSYRIGSHRERLPGKEAFVVMVTDGVTDLASDQEICDIVIQRGIQGGSLRGTPQDAANEILSYVSMLGTRDNATALVIRLGAWGEWSNWQDRTGKIREDRLDWCSQRRET